MTGRETVNAKTVRLNKGAHRAPEDGAAAAACAAELDPARRGADVGALLVALLAVGAPEADVAATSEERRVAA